MGQENNIDTAVSPVVVARLPRYHRQLRELIGCDVLRISSAELARQMNTTASQIRQDLNCFGGFGQQGYGYNVRLLYASISDILGVNDNYGAVIFGAGSLGEAIASHDVFAKRGVILRGVFDQDPELIGTTCAGFKVLDEKNLEEFCKSHDVNIAVITVSDDSAPSIAERAASCGIRGFWNFSPTQIPQQEGLTVQNVHLGDTLMTLCYEMKRADMEHEKA